MVKAFYVKLILNWWQQPLGPARATHWHALRLYSEWMRTERRYVVPPRLIPIPSLANGWTLGAQMAYAVAFLGYDGTAGASYGQGRIGARLSWSSTYAPRVMDFLRAFFTQGPPGIGEGVPNVSIQPDGSARFAPANQQHVHAMITRMMPFASK